MWTLPSNEQFLPCRYCPKFLFRESRPHLMNSLPSRISQRLEPFRISKKATALLNNNNLARFEADMFRTMLRQMEKGTVILSVRCIKYHIHIITSACIYFTSNHSSRVNIDPFDCKINPCPLAWLLLDDRHLLGAMCTKNGIRKLPLHRLHGRANRFRQLNYCYTIA